MAWWEWLPVVSTVGHILADPAGRKVEDYKGFAPTPNDCEGLGAGVAVLRCDDCIDRKMWQFVSDWIFSGAPADIVETVIAYPVGEFVELVTKALAKSYGVRVVVAGTGVGAVLLLDGMLDLMVQVKKAQEIYEAASEAKRLYCRCE